jgi:hypothetical protein
MSIVLDGTNGITTPDVDSTTSVTTPLVTNAGTLALSATGANVVTASTNGVERLRITSAGNVGVGATAPTSRLDVRSTTSGSSLSLLNLRADAAATGGATANFSVSAASDLITLNTGTDDALAFVTGGTSERARIDASGSLLVATTTTPIFNSSTLTGHLFEPNGVASHSSNSNTLLLNRTQTNGGIIIFHRAGSNVGNISVTTTNTAYNTSSDYRLKEDVQPMVGSVDRLMALKPVNFAWKVDGSRVDGFLAHEAQEVVPECVTGEKDAVDDEGNPQYQGIDQSKIVPLLVAALQEALTKIEALEARVAALETNA